MVVLYILLGYLLGSIPTGKLIGRIRGIDLQSRGSGNIGFANAVRVLGWKLGVIVLVGDVSKGFLAVWIASQQLTLSQLSLVAAATIIGNVYPLWLGFRGGKGVATGFGTMLALSLPVALVGALCYAAGFAVTKRSAVGSLLAATTLPVIALLFQPQIALFCAILTGFAYYTHRTNIRQMLSDKPTRKLRQHRQRS